jgi:cell wall-associated NlpC family hydrolase
MNKPVAFLSVLLSLEVALAASGFAIQRKHRPWFSHTPSSADSSRVSPSVPAKEPVTNEPAVVADNKLINDPGHKVAEQAISYKGTRYKFGGTSKHGLDCSGLVDRVWADLKMQKIPRASSALYNSGKPVHLAELRPGDLVFFKNTYKRGISHVGVYTGNNKFVHAAGKHKGVMITKLSDPYYQLHYAGARRLY